MTEYRMEVVHPKTVSKPKHNLLEEPKEQMIEDDHTNCLNNPFILINHHKSTFQKRRSSSISAVPRMSPLSESLSLTSSITNNNTTTAPNNNQKQVLTSISVMPSESQEEVVEEEEEKEFTIGEMELTIPQIILLDRFLTSTSNERGTNYISSVSEHDIDLTGTDDDHDTNTSRESLNSEITHSFISNKSIEPLNENLDYHSTTKVNESHTSTNKPSNRPNNKAFTKFRIQYLLVHLAIMLADGLQGTHLYVLYEGYGYSVSSLYSLGFVSGAITSPFIGPVVDKIGRKRAAMIYCIVEIVINLLEQYPIFSGLLLSRILGGVTTNLLFSVFESWLVTEHRQRKFGEDKLEVILRDSTIVSNSAAIISGYLAHCLADKLGPVGPFEGAVVLTSVAFVILGVLWSENYGSASAGASTWKGNMFGAYRTIMDDAKILRIGIIQGLTEGSLQTFVFLWSPALRAFATSAPDGAWGLDKNREPAYGLIFGAFMACGVIGGFAEPLIRSYVKKILSSHQNSPKQKTQPSNMNDHDEDVNPLSVHILCAFCYLASSILFLIPYLLNRESPYAFIICICAFLLYELLVGVYMPCEGVIRSIYMPTESICSLMTMLRVIVNVAVAVGVISTNMIPFSYAFIALSIMMLTSACLQISLLPNNDLKNLFNRHNYLFEKIKNQKKEQ
mmetsp:Transcript_9213/g.11616  ORF Transcript_9213/g.11616 Transcript_9213/m.11616 type:complete len:676 (-) Transcript_9213:1440-3467(-)